MERIDQYNFRELCTAVGAKDRDLKRITDNYGYPPLWVRPNSFATLVLTILEQQVSLASAYAAFKKLKERMGTINAKAFVKLSDEDLRGCYFSRQKIIYTRELANAIVSGQLSLKKLYYQDEEHVRFTLKKIKGIGDWTVDIYLLHALRRTNVFPIGDLALINAIKWVKDLPAATKEELIALSELWKPYRSIASMIFWHYYIKKKNIRLVH
jgi:DNA-3-methyladenine glycosylase II